MEKKKTSYKLLSIDLDGTLLSPILKKVSKEDCLALQEFMSLGGYAFVNTGRPPWATTKTTKRINQFGKNKIKLVSCMNGSYIIDYNDEKIYDTKMSHEYCTLLLNVVKRFSGITTIFYTTRGFARKQAEAYPSAIILKPFYSNANLITLKDSKDLTSYKINIISSSKKRIARLYHELMKENLQQIMTISHSSPRFLEITAKGIGKGYAIRLFAKKYNILKSEIVSIGDSFNDESGFKESALSIGINPKNPFFLSLCDRIVEHKENGVKEAIDTYIVKENSFSSNVKLIFSDLDGTLIDGKTKLYSAKTKLALQQCANHHIPLAIASGRGIYDGINIVKEMNLNPESDVYIIGNNGATIYDIYTKKYTSETPIKENDAIKVFNYVAKLSQSSEKNNVGLIIHTRSPNLMFFNPTFWKAYNFKKTGDENKYDPWVKTKPIYVNKYPNDIICYKFVVKFLTPSKSYAYCKKLQKMFPNLEICLSSTTNIEVNHKGVDKAFACRKVAKAAKVKLDEIMILGDGQNDITALKLNKNSYAPCYSPDYVRKAAAHVINNVDASTFASKVIFTKVFKTK